MERHHQLPRQFAYKFKRVGLDIEDYTVDLPKAAHRLKPDGLHVGKGAENWNGAWKQFFDTTRNPSKKEILDKLSEMRKSFGLE